MVNEEMGEAAVAAARDRKGVIEGIGDPSSEAAIAAANAASSFCSRSSSL
jgi:dihydrodipicolinate synthase/N-acetylneuraminate lyase